MRRTILIMAAMLGLLPEAEAQQAVQGVSVGAYGMEHSGGYMIVDMSLDMSGVQVDANRAVVVTPWIRNGGDSLSLPPVGIYGRRRYYYYRRNGESMLTGRDGTDYRAAQRPDTMAYRSIVGYREWMNGATLVLRREDYGCCNTLLAEQQATIGRYDEGFFPELVYMRPRGTAVKSDSLEGTAYIDFPVNKTEIYPDYRRNAMELGKVRATIDSVRGDRDISITSVWLKGYASPESPYSHNRELALGRTEALKGYIQRLYRFEDGVIATDYEPEDWEGLRRYVENSNLDHRAEILALIDSALEPDDKEARLRQRYPGEYRFLLQHCYPALRHTDYRIAYTIRSYSDVEEIRRVLHTQPNKLSLGELYLLSEEYEPGTQEFADVFETAVKLFPNDEAANLNAANAAMRMDNIAVAERYLAKAGDSPEAAYARGALAIRKKDYEAARVYLREAQDRGVGQAAATLEQLAQGRR